MPKRSSTPAVQSTAPDAKHAGQCRVVLDTLNSLQFDDRLDGADGLKARIVEFAQFVGHAARRPDLLAQPQYDLIERDVRGAGGRAGRGRSKKQAPLREATTGARMAKEQVRAAWLEWQRKPATYPDYPRFRDAMKGRRFVSDNRTLAGWCAGFVQTERVYVGWQRAHGDGLMPRVLRVAMQARETQKAVAA